MSTAELIPSLAFITLGIVLAVAVVQALAFFRKRRNREADADVDMGRRPVVSDGTGMQEQSRRL